MKSRPRLQLSALVSVSALCCLLVGCVPPTQQQRVTSSTTTTTYNTTIAGSAASSYDDWEPSYQPSETVSVSETVPSTSDGASDPVFDDTAAMDEADESADSVAALTPSEMANLVPIDIQLPAPAFRGTPVPLEEPNVEKPRGEPRPAFLAPEGTVNLALGKPVICSDPIPSAGEVDLVTDGDKEASDFGYLELRPGSEWVQIDLEQRSTVYAALLWHNHAEARVYRDVVVQVSDDPDFLDGTTVFNNDYDNTSGLGIGSDMGYVETSEGKLIDCRGVEGRFVRLYSMGSTVDGKNHYTEVEIYGKPMP